MAENNESSTVVGSNMTPLSADNQEIISNAESRQGGENQGEEKGSGPTEEGRADAEKEKIPAKSATKTADKKQKKPPTILSIAKKAAKKKKLKFNLTEKWLKARLEPGRCEVTGMEFAEVGPLSPAIRPIQSAAGYVKDNCRVVVKIYDRALGDDEHGALMAFARVLLSFREE